ncbi:MAG: hypothetical protein QOF48_68 [Verrucomicrobiota bacterium]|jgi:WD40 repeat protein
MTCVVMRAPIFSLLLALSPSLLAGAAAPDYSTIDSLFAKHCLDCHAAQDPEGKLVLESFESLQRGGESGPVLVPGNSSMSLIVKMVEGTQDAKRKIMPPGKRKKLEPAEIALLKSWIDAGARESREPKKIARSLVTPRLEPATLPRRPIRSISWSSSLKLLAIGRHGEVELFSPETRSVVRTLGGHRGQVNAVAFSKDGRTLASAAGEPALFGEAKLWNAADGRLLHTFQAHKDALYSIAISPDGKTLATGGYDQKIKLWSIATSNELHTLSAHNGCIFDLAFRPDGKILASASADRTVKLWNVATGRRTDTLAQPLTEIYAVAWNSDGHRLFAGGVDNRIRAWEISDAAAETTNPLLLSRFAHEGAILNLLLAPDGKTLLSSGEDGTLKLFTTDDVTEKLAFPLQPDLTPALAFLSDKAIAVGRLDGSLEFYDATNGKVVPPPAPVLSRVEPRGFQRGQTVTLELSGKNLAGVSNILFSHPQLTGSVIRVSGSTQLLAAVHAAADLPRGAYEISVRAAGGDSSKMKLHIDDLPCIYKFAGTNAVTLPINFWGVIDVANVPGEILFSAHAGQTLVLDLAVKSVQSKLANPSLTLLDASGVVLAHDSAFDGSDRFLVFHVPAGGRYVARVADSMLGSSSDHVYRLTVGALPVVTGIFPLSIPTNAPADVELIGINLPHGAIAHVKGAGPGEIDVPLDLEKFRTRQPFKVLVAAGPQEIEIEPNDQPQTAMRFTAPCAINGRIERAGDVDLFRFDARAGESWVLETDAAGRGSPVDTRLEVWHPDGRPVGRLLLQAVRNSAVTFRGIDSVTPDCRVENWEEMQLNDLLYMQGEVVKLFRAPQGPDSGFLFYTSLGKRRSHFDTSATAHALDEPCYVVEPHPLGTKLVPNGLPVFRLTYQNDDDGERRLGTDSKLTFAAPTNGEYLVRVTDTRGHGGERFGYRLVVRQPNPGFTVSVGGANPTVNPGSGQSFTVTAERVDGFEGEIRVDITGLPAGFFATTPLVIQAGHTEAKGSLNATLNAPKPEPSSAGATRLTATATIAGRPVTREVTGFGTIRLGDKPKLWVSLEAYSEGVTNHFDVAEVKPIEMTLVPGERLPAWLKIQRHGHDDLVTFFVENLPHGVIVDDIGLNGVLIPKGESERQIFLTAAKWVPEQDRTCYAIEQQAGKQTSRPVLLKIRARAGEKSARMK